MARSLTAGVTTAKNAQGNQPEILVVIQFASGTRYLAERDITFNAQAYEGLIDLIGPVSLDLDTLLHTMSIDINNLGPTPFSRQFLTDKPETTQVEVYLHFQEVTPDSQSDLVTLFSGEIKGAKYDFRRVRLELVETGHKLPKFPGDQITTTLLPSVAPEEVGNILPIVYGDVRASRAVIAAQLPETILTLPVVASDVTFTVQDTSDFPLSGSAKVNDEIFTYASKTGTTFSGISRGSADAHAIGSEIRRVGDETYILAGHATAIGSVSNIQVGGGPTVTSNVVNVSDTTTIPGKTVTSITFNDRPQGVATQIGGGTGRARIDFDSHTTNTGLEASNPEYGYRNGIGFTAMNHATLRALGVALPQQSLNYRRIAAVGNLGTLSGVDVVSRFFVQKNNLTVQPQIAFRAGGLFEFFQLGTPTTEASKIDVGGFDNIQHNHPIKTQTAIIRPQLATNSSPSNAWLDPNNGFDGSVTTNALSLSSFTGLDLFTMNAVFPYNESRSGVVKSIRIGTISAHGINNRGFSVLYTPVGGTSINFQVGPGLAENSLIKSVSVNQPNVSFADVLGGVMVVTSNLGTGASSLQDCWLEVTYEDQDILSTQPPVLDSTPSYEHRQPIDIATHFPNGFADFTNLDCLFQYPSGSIPETETHLFEMWLEAEFTGSGSATAEESTEVSADILGQVDDGAGTYTGTPNALIENGSDVIRHLLQVWGGLAVGDIDTAAFSAARVDLSAFVAGWPLAGVIREAVKFGDLLKVLGLNCRGDFIWEDGKARLLIVPDVAPATIHDFTAMNTLDGVAAIRRPMEQIINDVSVKYQMLQAGGGGGYNATSEAEDAPSISDFRRRTQQIQLDFVRNASVAANIRDYLLARRKEADRTMTVQSPLTALHLQRGDFVRFTESRLDLNNTICRVRKSAYAPGRALEGGHDVLTFEIEEF